jgi:ribosomal-protein-alanine N-acetyltransferase
MILETEHLRLRPLAASDAAIVVALRSDADVMAYWDSPEVGDPAEGAAFLDWCLAEVAAGLSVYWVIERLSDEAVVGICDISEIDRRHRRADVGYMLGKAFWAQGYGAEALAAIVDDAAPALGLRRLTARVHVGNNASIALLGKLGFQREGLLRGYIERGGERRDCFLYGLLL